LAVVDSTSVEIQTQPETWERAASVESHGLPADGEKVAVIGCGTSYHVALAFAAIREAAGLGTTDAHVASEFSVTRPLDRVLAISRSGTTTEVVRALASLPDGMDSAAISAVEGTPVVDAADQATILSFADEESVVQTRFATGALALLRAHVGHDLRPVIAEAGDALARELPCDPAAFDRFVFLGHGWSVGLAHEAALKLRESALAWSESYPEFEYRHGPISLADGRTLVWFLSEPDVDLRRDIARVGATVVHAGLDPMAELVLIQRTAVALARVRGLDPDHPRNLTRSVVLG
jgi:fructoselysine-6-P-deglycase FrlB-like protein